VAAIVAAALLAGLSFVLTWSIVLRLHGLQVLSQYDAWFETDPKYYMAVFTRGPFWLYVRHPLLAEFGYIPVALVTAALTALGWGGESAVALREQLALLVIPTIAAGRTIIFLSLFIRVLGRLGPASMLCLIDIFSASTVTVCSVPESYAFSAAVLAAAFWLGLDDTPRQPWVRWGMWLLVAAVAIGVTSSNAVPVAILAAVWLVRHGRSLVNSGAVAAGLVASAAVVVGAAVFASAWAFAYPIGTPMAAFAPAFTHPPSLSAATGIAWAMAHTFLAPLPSTEPLWTMFGSEPRHDFMFSYAPPYAHGWPSVWRAAITVAMVGFGSLGCRRSPTLALVPIAAFAILASNAAAHLYYGLHYNLYAGHWQSALLVTMAGIVALHPARNWLGTAALGLYALLTASSAIALLRYTFTYLSEH
jgi:hypothetical protein